MCTCLSNDDAFVCICHCLSYVFPVWPQKQLKSAGLNPVLSLTDKSCNTIFVSQCIWANKTGFNLIFFYFNIRGSVVSKILCYTQTDRRTHAHTCLLSVHCFVIYLNHLMRVFRFSNLSWYINIRRLSICLICLSI